MTVNARNILSILPLLLGGATMIALAIAIELRDDKPQSTPLPLTGNLFQDFGIVEITGEHAQLTHTFTLRNQSSEQIVIKSITTTCGCSHASIDTHSIPPREEAHLLTTMRLSDSGVKNAQVILITNGANQETLLLKLRAEGRRSRNLVLSKTFLDLGNESESVLVYAMIDQDDAPPAPLEVDLPNTVDGKIEGWTRVHPKDPQSGESACWENRVILSLRGSPSWKGITSALVHVSGLPSATLKLTNSATATQ